MLPSSLPALSSCDPQNWELFPTGLAVCVLVAGRSVFVVGQVDVLMIL